MNKQFEEWLKEYLKKNRSLMLIWGNLPFSMKWGVYLEFFDSVGIQIEVWRLSKWEYNIVHGEGIALDQIFETRTEAQQEAIKKAFEILLTL